MASELIYWKSLEYPAACRGVNFITFVQTFRHYESVI